MPVTPQGGLGDGFHLFPLSTTQSCYRHVCPLQYSFEGRNETEGLTFTDDYAFDVQEAKLRGGWASDEGFLKVKKWSVVEEQALVNVGKEREEGVFKKESEALNVVEKLEKMKEEFAYNR